MLISAAAQRQKSWSCEHCRNWRETKDEGICRRCFWASPEDYDHIAMEQRRRVDVFWVGDEVAQYEKLRAVARRHGTEVAQAIKDIIRDRIEG